MKKSVVLIAVLLALSAALCLFDQGHEPGAGHGTSPDLCLITLVVSLAPVLLGAPLLYGWAGTFVPVKLSPVPVYLLEPQPKTATRS